MFLLICQDLSYVFVVVVAIVVVVVVVVDFGAEVSDVESDLMSTGICFCFQIA